MRYAVTIVVKELDVREGPFLVEATDEWKARTKGMGEYLCTGRAAKLSGQFVDYEVTKVPTLFSGDWEWNDDLEAWETAFPAVRMGDPWNGFPTPVVSHDVLTALVARFTILRSSGMPDLDLWEWVEGTGIVRVISQNDDTPGACTYLEPDEDGNYDLGVLGYTWATVGVGDRVVRTVTPPNPTPCEWCGELGSVDREDGPVSRYEEGDFHAGCLHSFRDQVTR